ncbi:MAG: hypothetical protein V2J26_08920 [Pacificimonas sp.]|jgi:hypothetical protein|nr:hypothetical protein [Pacificimonas sp.]
MSEMSPIAVEGALACDFVGETTLGLLDALLDSMALAKPGVDAAMVARELARLGDGAAYVAQEVEGLLHDPVTASPAGPVPAEPRAARG